MPLVVAIRPEQLPCGICNVVPKFSHSKFRPLASTVERRPMFTDDRSIALEACVVPKQMSQVRPRMPRAKSLERFHCAIFCGCRNGHSKEAQPLFGLPTIAPAAHLLRRSVCHQLSCGALDLFLARQEVLLQRRGGGDRGFEGALGYGG